MSIVSTLALKATKNIALTTREKFYLTPVMLLAETNPKKKPSMSYDRFENYFAIDWTTPQTVASCLDAGLRMDDIRHDSAHGFIHLGEGAPVRKVPETVAPWLEEDIAPKVEEPKTKKK
jgi:hypothetical protein